MHEEVQEAEALFQHRLMLEPGQGRSMVAVNEATKALAVQFVLNCPRGRERDNAIDRLQEAMAWAFRSIERKGD